MYCGNANERQDAGSDHSSAAKGSAIDLEVTGSGSVAWLPFFHSLLFLYHTAVLQLVLHLIYSCLFLQINYVKKEAFNSPSFTYRRVFTPGVVLLPRKLLHLLHSQEMLASMH